MANELVPHRYERGYWCRECPVRHDCTARPKNMGLCRSDDARNENIRHVLRHRDLIQRLWYMLAAIGMVGVVMVFAIAIIFGKVSEWGL